MKRLVRKYDVTASIGMYDLKNLPKVVEQYGGYDIRHDDKRYSIWKEREFYGDAMNLDDAELIVDCLNDDTKITSSWRVGRTGRIVASRSKQYSDFSRINYDEYPHLSYPEFFGRISNIYRKTGIMLSFENFGFGSGDSIIDCKLRYSDPKLDDTIEFTITDIPIIRTISGIDYDTMIDIVIEKISDAISPYLSDKIFKDDSYKDDLDNIFKNIKFSRKVRGRKVTANSRIRRNNIMASDESIESDESGESSEDITVSNASGWRGCPEIEMEYYNNWADPSLIYNGYRFNYYDIENALWSTFLDIYGYKDSDSNDPAVEKEFDEFVCGEGPAYLDECIANGYFEGKSKDWRDRY